MSVSSYSQYGRRLIIHAPLEITLTGFLFSEYNFLMSRLERGGGLNSGAGSINGAPEGSLVTTDRSNYTFLQAFPAYRSVPVCKTNKS